MKPRHSFAMVLVCFSFVLGGCAASTEEPTASTATSKPKETLSAPLPSSASSDDESPTATTDGTPPASEDPSSPDPLPATATTPATPTTPAPATPTPAAPSGPSATPGPAPTSTCSVTKDSLGFFNRTSAKSDYVAYVPASYSKSKPMRLIVGLHGCGDSALNFAKWAVNPWSSRATQSHIGISVGGETGGSKCWNIGGDDDKVMAAVEDIAKCFWIDRSKVVIAGYSSGGQLAYRVGLQHAAEFAGIIIEDSGLYAAGSTPQALLAGAAWKLNIAHRTHTNDGVFPLSKVKADWSLTQNAGFPITTSETAGTHDGDGEDWAQFLVPKSAAWVSP